VERLGRGEWGGGDYRGRSLPNRGSYGAAMGLKLGGVGGGRSMAVVEA